MKRRNNKLSKLKYIVIFFVFAFAFVKLDKAIFNHALVLATMQINNRVNKCINTAIKNITSEKKLVSSDFYYMTKSQNGNITSMSTNTVLLNEVCSELAVTIPEEFKSQGKEAIKIPLGSLSGIEYISGWGPFIKMSLLPFGESEIDFASDFKNAGINQINFQVWLNVKFVYQIVNPFQKRKFTAQRKIAIVNTIINGEVPNSYFNNTTKNTQPY